MTFSTVSLACALHGRFSECSVVPSLRMSSICTICGSTNNRGDNLLRHIKEKHKKILKSCECGRQLTASSLARHRRTACPLSKFKGQLKKSHENKQQKSPDYDSDRNMEVVGGQNREIIEVVDIQSYKIETTVQMIIRNGGPPLLMSNEISIGGMEFVIIPKGIGLLHSIDQM